MCFQAIKTSLKMLHKLVNIQCDCDYKFFFSSPATPFLDDSVFDYKTNDIEIRQSLLHRVQKERQQTSETWYPLIRFAFHRTEKDTWRTFVRKSWKRCFLFIFV